MCSKEDMEVEFRKMMFHHGYLKRKSPIMTFAGLQFQNTNNEAQNFDVDENSIINIHSLQQICQMYIVANYM